MKIAKKNMIKINTFYQDTFHSVGTLTSGTFRIVAARQ